MRLVRFGGAVSLDGYIAGPNGEYDWIVMDPEIDFAEMMNRYDTFLIGRKTFDAMRKMGGAQEAPGIQNIIFSRTLKPADFPKVRIEDDAERVVRELRNQPGKDIALLAAGICFAACSSPAWSITSRSPSSPFSSARGFRCSLPPLRA